MEVPKLVGPRPDRGSLRAVEKLLAHLTVRHTRYRGCTCTYNHTERTALQDLTSRHGLGESALSPKLIQAGCSGSFHRRTQCDSGRCGILQPQGRLERLTDYQRSHAIDKGAEGVVGYENFMTDRDPAELAAIAKLQRTTSEPHRRCATGWSCNVPGPAMASASPEGNEVLVNIDDQIAGCHQFDDGTSRTPARRPLGYWTNEYRLI